MWGVFWGVSRISRGLNLTWLYNANWVLSKDVNQLLLWTACSGFIYSWQWECISYHDGIWFAVINAEMNFPWFLVHYYHLRCQWVFRGSYDALAQAGVQALIHFPLELSGESTVWQVYRLVCHGQYGMFDEITISQVFIMKGEDLLIIIDQLDKMALLLMHKIASFFMFNWKGNQSSSFLKLMSENLCPA